MSTSGLVLAQKRCSTCSTTKPISEFHTAKDKSDGLRADCKECYNRKSSARQRKRRERMGEEAWLAHQREIVARSRKRRDYANERRRERIRRRVTRELIERHRDEFDALWRIADYEEPR